MENPRLLVMSEIMRGQSFEVTKDSFVIGRVNGEGVDLSIGDKSLSNKHASVILKDDQYYIQDLNSTNATLLNGKRLAAEKLYPLHDGEILQFGSIEVLFEKKEEYFIASQTGIDLTSTIGNLELELMTNLSPIQSDKKNWKNFRKFICYGLIFLFIIVLILVMLVFSGDK